QQGERQTANRNCTAVATLLTFGYIKSVIRSRGAAPGLDRRSPCFRGQPPFFRPLGGLCGTPSLLPDRGAPHQFDQPGESLFAVTALAAMGVGGDDDDPVLRQAAAG